MTDKPKRMSRHITLKKEAIDIYDKWVGEGETHKVSQAIVEFDGKAENNIDIRLEEIERRLKELEGKK